MGSASIQHGIACATFTLIVWPWSYVDVKMSPSSSRPW